MTGLGKKFLNAAEIDRGIEEVVQISKGSGSSPVLVGGTAMQLYGSNRLTKDVDFIARSVPKGFTVEKRLSFGGVSGKTPSGVPVCIIVRDDDFKKLYGEAHRNAVPFRTTRVVTPEYLAAMKLVAGRPKDEEDLKTLLVDKRVNLPKAREMIRRLLGAFAAKEFDSYVDEADWVRHRNKK